MNPHMLNHYRVLRQLGAGGMGAVYLAEDGRLRRQVALKVMKEPVASDPARRQRFLQEARAAAALNHPNIATVHSIEEEGELGNLLLVMEYVEGETLEHLLQSKYGSAGLPAEEAVSLLIPVASALSASHRRGIVHRDIKSANIMCTPDGQVKVLDFGIAKVNGSLLETEQLALLGTLNYMSPEQARGETIDHRTDLWSLGVVLHELLTGQLPFHSESAVTVLYNIVHTEPKEFADANPHPQIAPSLREVLRRALAKDRSKRYASAEEMGAELTRCLGAASLTFPGVTTAVEAGVTHGIVPTGTLRYPHRSTAERRQITFLFCELASRKGSSEEADPEEYAVALNALDKLCRSAALRYGGFVPEGPASSGLVYFGYPVAHEDDALRALRAGLELRDEALATICAPPTNCEIHLGISTSLAIVEATRSKSGSMDEAVIGEGSKMARALAQLPHPNQLLIEAASRRLAPRGIEYRTLGAVAVPGTREPLTLFEVVGQAGGFGGEFHAESRSEVAPLAGRRQELALMTEHWAQAVTGHGRAVLLAGNAGMGKSRLVYELKQNIDLATTPLAADWICSPFHTSSPLFPVLSWVERTWLDAKSETEQGRPQQDDTLSRLRDLLRQFELDGETFLPVLAPLLSIAVKGNFPVSPLTPDRQRALAMEALLAILLESATRQPVLLVVEDVHWADPTTLELLGMLLDYLPGVPLLCVLTHRPEFKPPWASGAHLSSISLSPLPREEVISLAMGIAGSAGIHPSVLEHLVRNADGTPLFAEELAMMVVEAGIAQQALDATAQTTRLAMPKTLRDSFMARLDRLGDAKHVAQIASVLGREFSRHLLLRLLGVSEQELQANVQELLNAGVLYLRGRPGRQVLVFKHALLQEAAYESLVKKDRIALHTEAAEALEKDEELSAEQPELLGHHFQEAGLYARAIEFWQRAGMKALQRSAHKEAIATLRRALGLHKRLPAGQAADATELLLLTCLGPSLIATQGFGAAEVGRNFDRALQLSGDDNGSALLLPALFGVWLYKLVRGDLAAAEEVARRLVDAGEANADDDMRIEGYWALGDVQFWRGDLLQAQANFEKTLVLYNRDRFSAHAFSFSQDPMVAALCYLGFVSMVQGNTAGAWRSQQAALTLAGELKHAFSIGWALGFSSTMAYFGDDPGTAIREADTALKFYAEQAYPFWVTSCQAAKGWGLCRMGSTAEGLELIYSALAGMRLIGSELVLPLFTGMLAESQLLAGELEAASLTVTEGIAQAREKGATVTEISLQRIYGDILLSGPVPDPLAARVCFEHSLGLAETCGANRFRQAAMERLKALTA